MSLLDAATLAALVAIDESAMIDTATVKSYTSTTSGGVVTETESSSTDVPCYFWTLSGDQFDGDQARELGKHRMAIPKDTAIAQNSRVVYGGRTYIIKYLFPLNGYSTSRLLGLEER
jgi:hypothetical protein